MEDFIKNLKASTLQVDLELSRNLFFTESNYQNALIHFLKMNIPQVSVNREVHINYTLSDGYIFGSGRADIIVESKTHVYIIELKAGVDCKYIRKYIGQTLRYVSNYRITDKQTIGILVVFNSHCGKEPMVKILK